MRSRIAVLVLSVFMLSSVGVARAVAAPAASSAQTAAEVAETADGMQVMADVVAQLVPQAAGPVRAACAAAAGGVSPDATAALRVLKAELAKSGSGASTSSFGSCLLKGINVYKTCMRWVHNSKWCGALGGGIIGICLYDLWS